jgi:putative methanogenesis marker protein 1
MMARIPLNTDEFAPSAATFLGNPELTSKVTRSAGHRVRSVSDTVRIAESRLRPLGITRIADITGLDVLGIPVYNSVRPTAADGNLTVTSGKGMTSLAARTSAMMEAIERYYGEPQGRSGITCSLNELRQRGQLALDPRQLILERDVKCGSETPIEWVPARELTRDRVVYVPAGSIFVPYEGQPRLFGSSSNGLASGNSLPEATLHALLEVIERDATAFAELAGPGFEISRNTLPQPALDLVEAMESANIDVIVRYLESDSRLPTFHVFIDDTMSGDPMLINGGFGCHPDPLVGVCRALTEAAQSRLSVISGAREDLVEQEQMRTAGYSDIRSRLAPWFEKWPERSFQEIDDLSRPTIAEDLSMVISNLRKAGLRVVLACNLAAMESDLAVVKTVVPGLEVAHTQPKRIGPRLTRALSRI